MSDKALSNAELELTQRIQIYFPRGIIDVDTVKKWNGCRKETIRTLLTQVFSRSPEQVLSEYKSMLEPLGTVTVPATRKFVPEEKFVVDTSSKTPVNIYYLGDNFPAWFFGKVEKSRLQTTLRYAFLIKRSADSSILDELGDTAETTLAEIYALMKRQPDRDEVGVLLTNGYANIFYVRAYNGVLCIVAVRWQEGGWCVIASSINDSDEWDISSRVFSRSS